MRIGILGAGKHGSTLARLFVSAGHQVTVSNSRGPESLRELVEELGPEAQAATMIETARTSEIIVLAVPWHKPEALPPPELVAGKIVIDTMNPYREDGGQFDLGNSTASEVTLKRLPGSRLVKAFNTIWFKDLAESSRPDLPIEQRRAIFLAGDDQEAKNVVAMLIEQIGFAPVDTGNLREGGRRQQYGTPLYTRPMSGAEGKVIVASMLLPD